MKNFHRKLSLYLSYLLLAILALAGLSACGEVDGWDPTPPSGWNTFFDRRLNGCWKLVQANGRPVAGQNVNYLDFFGSGRGRYYYYTDGNPDSERMAYWCQNSTNGASYYQMNLQYQYSSPSTVNYWFTDNQYYLWLQWGTGAGVVTYVYQAVDAPGW